jgi:hypothetical protein
VCTIYSVLKSRCFHLTVIVTACITHVLNNTRVMVSVQKHVLFLWRSWRSVWRAVIHPSELGFDGPGPGAFIKAHNSSQLYSVSGYSIFNITSASSKCNPSRYSVVPTGHDVQLECVAEFYVYQNHFLHLVLCLRFCCYLEVVAVCGAGRRLFFVERAAVLHVHKFRFIRLYAICLNLNFLGCNITTTLRK